MNATTAQKANKEKKEIQKIGHIALQENKHKHTEKEYNKNDQRNNTLCEKPKVTSKNSETTID